MTEQHALEDTYFPNLKYLEQNRNSAKCFTMYDGFLGTTYRFERREFFVTCPLPASEMPEPPVGSERPLQIHADGTYGMDDYLAWPQFYNESYCHLPCIPLAPFDEGDYYWPDRIMWQTKLTNEDIAWRKLSLEGDLGILKASFSADVIAAAKRVHARQKDSEVAEALGPDKSVHRRSMQLWERIIQDAMTRIADESSLYVDLQRGWAEIRRAWFNMSAWMDYMTKYKEVMNTVSDVVPQTPAPCMGVFTLDARVLGLYTRAGIRVYFIRPSDVFDRQIIRRAVAMKRYDEVSNPVLHQTPVIHRGTSFSDEKYYAILKATANMFGASSSANLLLFQPPSTVSLSVNASTQMPLYALDAGPSTSKGMRAVPYTTPSASQRREFKHQASRWKGKGKEKEQKKKKEAEGNRSKFDELQGPMAPPPNRAWEHINSLIDQDQRRADSHPQPDQYWFPEPGLFCGAKPERAQLFFKNWRDIWRIYQVYALQNGPQLVKNLMWRTMLNMDLTQPPPMIHPPMIQSHAAELQSQARALIQTWKTHIQTNDATEAHTNVTSTTTVEDDEARRLIWELCQLNFRAELTELDALLAPPPRTHNSNAAVAWKELRQAAINECFSGQASNLALVSLRTAACGMADAIFEQRVKYWKAFRHLMDSWPGPKPDVWHLGTERTIDELESLKWERGIALYYAQSFYNVYGRPPVLPRNL